MAPLRAWIEGTATTVDEPADLDAVLDRTPSSGLILVSGDEQRRLHIFLNGGQSGLVWETESDILLSLGPVPPGAPPGLIADDVEALDDPRFAIDDAEAFEITEELARQAGHDFLRTGERPTCVQWIVKP